MAPTTTAGQYKLVIADIPCETGLLTNFQVPTGSGIPDTERAGNRSTVTQTVTVTSPTGTTYKWHIVFEFGLKGDGTVFDFKVTEQSGQTNAPLRLISVKWCRDLWLQD